MNTQIQKQDAPPSALALMADRLQVSQQGLMDTLKATVFKGCTNEEFMALVIVAQTYGLNPLLKEIYAFPARGKGIVPLVGVDGWLKIINTHPEFDGMDVTISDDGEEATCTIHVKNRNHPTTITEYLSECKRPTDPWKTMPKRMLRNKVIIQAGRVAFGISGIQDEDEAKDTVRNVTPKASDTPKAREVPINPFNPPSPEPAAPVEAEIVETVETQSTSEELPL